MKDDWRLDELKLEFKKWGEDKGNYAGSISFSNGDCESFRFKIRPDMAEAYINLLAVDIVIGADSLAERLVESLGIRKEEE